MELYIIFISLVTMHNQLVVSQMLRPPPFNLIKRPLGENIIETGNYLNPLPPTVISEPPCNSFVPIPNINSPPSTTIITDCSPSICQNLANTIQLMIVSNLLQNRKSSELAMQISGPILNAVMTSPTLSCGCNNPLSPNLIPPNVITPNFIPSNVIDPNIFPPNFVNPNVVSPNFVQLPPRVVSPANGCPNNVIPNLGLPVNANGLLSTIMGMLGNMRG